MPKKFIVDDLAGARKVRRNSLTSCKLPTFFGKLINSGSWRIIIPRAMQTVKLPKMVLKGGSMSLIKSLEDRKSMLSQRSKSDPSSGEIAQDGIIGNFGPILGGPSPAPQEGVSAPVK